MWNIFLNILYIILAYCWEWFTGESEIYRSHSD